MGEKSSVYAGAMSSGLGSQKMPIPGREHEMVVNSEGYYVFGIDGLKQLERFLILGSDAGSYYVNKMQLTRQNAVNVIKLLAMDGKAVVDMAVQFSVSGRAPKNDPALFVIALAASSQDSKTREYALQALPKVARTGTHLFNFAEYVSSMRGWGRGLRSAIAQCYMEKTDDELAIQFLKYQKRNGWSHKDLLRLSHVKSDRPAFNAMAKYILRRELSDGLPRLFEGFEKAKKADANELAKIIRDYELTWEMVPTNMLNKPQVWEALLEKMPMMAMIRNIGKMTSVGLLASGSEATKLVVSRLEDKQRLIRSRVHPIAILMASRTYSSSKGLKGKLKWQPVMEIKEALESAFYMAFSWIKPTGKSFYLAVDVSSSMSYTTSIASGMSSCELAAAMALVTAKTEKNSVIYGFCSEMVPLNITAEDTIESATSKAQMANFGDTECATAIKHAMDEKMNVDAFIVLTDNETNGHRHPSEVLKEYRRKLNPEAKMIVEGFTATECSIADPKDPGMLDIAGFDSSVPAIIRSFVGAYTGAQEEE